MKLALVSSLEIPDSHIEALNYNYVVETHKLIDTTTNLITNYSAYPRLLLLGDMSREI